MDDLALALALADDADALTLPAFDRGERPKVKADGSAGGSSIRWMGPNGSPAASPCGAR